ncbi:MAG: geranylgeranylglyceryl/heptaprenylglyceryl phosphate synthase [Cyclobacteriaceae bacterium]|nr:geranylgeranylglyceryl/heptaprenylglyceryl phosphate synthase [Cyclobacteriaceae bacterium]
MNVYRQVFLPKNKSFAVLIDPDKTTPNQAKVLIEQVNSINEISALLVGGSLVSNDSTQILIQFIKTICHKPIILFPGNVNQICKADAILFLSLISGRNPEYLIGQHIIGAPLIKNLEMEAIATGYMLVGEPSSTSYVSNTTPLPANKPDLAQATAIAGEMLGNSLIYMDAGSGAHQPISEVIIEAVAQAISIPLIVGGGIRTYEYAKKALIAGGRCLVVGNAAESDSAILYEIASAVSDVNRVLEIHQ